MDFSFDKIHHLIRYFLILGIIAFVGYIKAWNDYIFFHIMGPIVYLAYYLKSLTGPFLSFIKLDPIQMNQFGYILPICLIYFALLGFLFKQLWNEEGFFKYISMLALLGFLGYIHYLSGTHLIAFVTPLS